MLHHRKLDSSEFAKMGRLPVYHTKAERDAARKAAMRKYHTKRRVTVQRLKGLVRLSDSQTTLREPPQIQQARALLVQARALLQWKPSSTCRWS